MRGPLSQCKASISRMPRSRNSPHPLAHHATCPSDLITRADLYWNEMKAPTCSLLGHISLSFTQRNAQSQSHTACLAPGFCILTLLVTRCKRQCKSITVTGNTTQKTCVTDGRSEQWQDSEASKTQLDSHALISSWATSCLPPRLRHNRIEHRPIHSRQQPKRWADIESSAQTGAEWTCGISSWAIEIGNI